MLKRLYHPYSHRGKKPNLRLSNEILKSTDQTQQMSAHLDLVVSIINYRTADLTIACVQSVINELAQSPDLSAQIVVVDNASGDGSLETLGNWIATLPDTAPVRLIASPQNTGFSGGHNQGLTAAQARYYLVLNSDAVLKDGFLAAILEDADAHENVGLFAPRIDYDDGGQQISCFRFHSPQSEFIRGAATGPITKLLAKYDVPLDMPPSPEDIQWASFACILLRGTMIDEVGLMDDGYFLYFEDTAYCAKARRKGWAIRYVPQACMIHFRGGSAPVKSLAKARKRLPAYYYASRTRMLYQSYGHLGLLAANLGWHLGRLIAGSRGLFGKERPQAIAQEGRDIWINFLTPLGDRRAVET